MADAAASSISSSTVTYTSAVKALVACPMIWLTTLRGTPAAKQHRGAAVPQIVEADRGQASPGVERDDPLADPLGPQRRAVLAGEPPARVRPLRAPCEPLG